jgi:two-component system, OmpR family, sensor histidine kinase KdpD
MAVASEMPEPQRHRVSPEQLLKRIEAEDRQQDRGKLKVFLGYASGVGKSFRMLDEGRRRKLRGQDVVVAAVQPEAPPDVVEILAHFEVIPPRMDLGGPCIDVDAILRRRPAVCLIDGLAYRNPPGSKNPERWQDVEELLANGVSVITTINLQYIAEKQRQVEAIRGKKVRDVVPETFLRKADEIEVVDAPPEYCVTRTENGQPIPASEVTALEKQMSELRELALVLAAEVVDQQLADYLRKEGIEQTFGTHERILVCVTPRSNGSLMISRAKRQAERFHGELFVAYVEQDNLSPRDRATLEQNLEAARAANASVEILHGEDPVAAILNFAESHGISQIFVGHSLRSGAFPSLRPNPVERLILEADGIDVRIFPHGGSAGGR